MTLASGSRLGPYEIVAAIGAGGMGEVYRARDTRLDRVVAVKVLPAHVAEAPEFRERFEREARTVAALSHPHICSLYDVGTHEQTAFRRDSGAPAAVPLNDPLTGACAPRSHPRARAVSKPVRIESQHSRRIRCRARWPLPARAAAASRSTLESDSRGPELVRRASASHVVQLVPAVLRPHAYIPRSARGRRNLLAG
ncbi:MAG: hypothetical protein FJW14_07305 [Acidimicrobiia bacterium]|nr:hypothetical protein [Acidimicrobiia bacterium]